jgi:hypothetical protein
VISLSKASIDTTGTDTVQITVTALDANRNALPGATVTIVPDSGTISTGGATVTNSSGVLVGTLDIGGDKSNRTISLTVKSGTVTRTASVLVDGAQILATITSDVVAPGSTNTVTYQLVDKNLTAMANFAIEVDGPSTVTGTTDATGHFSYTFTAPSTGSTSTIVAKAAGVTSSHDFTITSSSVPPAIGTVLSSTISANPQVVSVNTGTSTSNQVEVRALFLGANNLPIKNIRVRFDLDGDTNNIGGTLASGTGYVYSDNSGYARTQYIPGNIGSGTDKVKVRACWNNNDFTAGASGAPCPSNQEVVANITVTSAGTSISAFTNLKISTDDVKSVYRMNFAVAVVDAAGRPRSGVTVTYAKKLTAYYKGFWTGGGPWTLASQDAFGGALPVMCQNEDINGNLKLDTNANASQDEDANGSTHLEPDQADATIYPASAGSDVTDQFGKAYFVLEWGQSVAGWSAYQLDFSATVDGTEGHFTYKGDALPIPADALSGAGAPPFVDSPYGVRTSGTISVTDPGTGTVVPLCNNKN